MENLTDKPHQEKPRLKEEFRERAVGYILAAFGLVAGLAWNEAIQALINQLFPLQKNTFLAKFAYAILVTILVVVVSTYVMRLFERKDGQDQN
jgi:hypothetical protein